MSLCLKHGFSLPLLPPSLCPSLSLSPSLTLPLLSPPPLSPAPPPLLSLPLPPGDTRQPQFQGSYYVLEVGNFDPVDDATMVSPPASGNSVTTPTELPADYYMLDLQNIDNEGESSKVNHRDSNRFSTYENIPPSTGSKVSTPEPHLSPKHHNGTAPPPLSQTPPTSGQPGIQGVTVYENVIISALGVPEPILPVEHPYSVPPPSASIPSAGREPTRPPRADGRGSWVGPVEDESGYTLVDELSRKRLGPGGIVVNSRLPDCYEERKLRASENSSQLPSNDTPAPIAGHVTDHVTQSSPKKNNSKRRDEVYEVINVGGAKKPRPSSVPKVQVNGLNGAPDDRHGNTTVEGTNIIDNSRDNPFAGLVMSASRQLEESLPLLSSSPHSLGEGEQERKGEMSDKFRGRVDTVWDDVRMEKEWTKVRRRGRRGGRRRGEGEGGREERGKGEGGRRRRREERGKGEGGGGKEGV